MRCIQAHLYLDALLLPNKPADYFKFIEDTLTKKMGAYRRIDREGGREAGILWHEVRRSNLLRILL